MPKKQDTINRNKKVTVHRTGDAPKPGVTINRYRTPVGDAPRPGVTINRTKRKLVKESDARRASGIAAAATAKGGVAKRKASKKTTKTRTAAKRTTKKKGRQ